MSDKPELRRQFVTWTMYRLDPAVRRLEAEAKAAMKEEFAAALAEKDEEYIQLNTTYSFGLDDQEVVVAFETDIAADFLDLVQELRETEASKYTLRDTPMFTCVRTEMPAILDELL